MNRPSDRQSETINLKSSIPSTPCGSRTRPWRFERPPTSPEVERGALQQRSRPGVASSPGRRFFRMLALGGYPLVSKPLTSKARSVFATIAAKPAAVRRSSLLVCQRVMML